MAYLRDEFRAWMANQPRREDPAKHYEEATIDAAVYKLKSGLKTLGVQAYENVDCFDIASASEFKPLYDACYKAAKASDKKAKHSDFRNGLDFYLKFLIQRDLTADDSPVLKKIRELVAAYKADFKQRDKDERYKWIAAGWYKQKWNIEAADFSQMYGEAFDKKYTLNLLTAQHYMAYDGVVSCAKMEPETVRGLFRQLYDESVPFDKRYADFRGGFTKFPQAKGRNQYQDQDLHAISVYLFFEYPSKYYIYQYTIYDKLKKLIGCFEDKLSDDAQINNILNYGRICDCILSIVKKAPELLDMSHKRLTPNCCQDEEYHLLATDIAYFGSLPKTAELINPQLQYWPSLSEYDPHITKEMWQDLLNDKAVTSEDDLRLLKMILELGGESTCANLAATYGGAHSYYNMLGSNFGGKVKKKLGLADCKDPYGKIRLFPIPFVGRDIQENGNKRFSWKLRDELKEALKSMDLSNIETTRDNTMQDKTETEFDKNIILYGPPGTGKTYNSIVYAVAIIENSSLDAIGSEPRDEVRKRYNDYRAAGRIEFTTFHQSYGYEEFIEGIKPVADEEDAHGCINYEITPGVFRRFCEKATAFPVTDDDDYGINDFPVIWKVSLEGSGDNATRRDCMENGHIRIGWGEYGAEINDQTNYYLGGESVLNAFINKMKKGDLVLSCYSATTIDAVGVVTGDYEWQDDFPKYPRLRKVRWLVKGINEDITKINNGRSLTLSSVYQLKVSLSDVMAIVEKYSSGNTGNTAPAQNYVFIIDEINRGNISKIFGELITLIEPDKRLGCDEEVKAVLPYSGTSFGVPDNLYIIGTMNTADRSIAVIDTALRRRFSFREIIPDPEVLAGVNVEGISIKDMLVKINERITALYDREHTIGHSCFMPLIKDPSLPTLAGIFKDKIIPLLQEYFYDDYEKIRLVLGDNQKKALDEAQFIIAEPFDNKKLFGDTDEDLEEKISYTTNEDAFNDIGAYRNFVRKREDA